MGFELLCMMAIGLLFGLAIVFFGYRLFIVLLPIWGFFFGLGMGAQTVQLIFGDAFLATITSWVVVFIVGMIFAVLSYLFYLAGVAILSASAGYGLTVALLGAIGLSFGFIVWVIGIIVGVILAYVVLKFNIQKYAVIVITAVGGTGAIIFTLLAGFGGLSPLDLIGNPVMTAISDSFLWLLFFAVVAIAGIVVQVRANRAFEAETYNRWAS
jgi:hypothetical protein